MTIPKQIDEAAVFVAKHVRFGWDTDEMPRNAWQDRP
jgi:hypothetical protein